jgi:hypothetical protein
MLCCALMDAEQTVDQVQPKRKWAWRQPTPFRQGAVQIGIAVVAAFYDQRACYPHVGAWIVSAVAILVILGVIPFVFAGARGNWRGFGNFLLALSMLWVVASREVPPKPMFSTDIQRTTR